MEEEKFIKIDEAIERARFLGVDFGKGNPRNRLRYYAKLGLLPPAKRKIFEGKLPTGAYPESVIDILVDIERELKKGKTLHKIVEEKKQQEESKEAFLPSETVSLRRGSFFPPEQVQEPERSVRIFEKEPEPSSLSEGFSFKPKGLPVSVLSSVLIFLSIAAGLILLFLGIMKSDAFFAALVGRVGRIAQVESPLDLITETPLSREEFLFRLPEPYLTINAETDINAPLNLKNRDGASTLNFFQNELQGTVVLGTLTEDRTYVLPNQTGTICLSTGNCLGLAGEVTAPGGTANRLAKFIAGQRIGDASISDMYDGVSIHITSAGNVGIGTDDPDSTLHVAGDITTDNLFAGNLLSARTFYAQDSVGIGTEASDYALEVDGRIQATGDVCTDLGGGKCLSEVSAGTTVFLGGGSSGISGSGSSGYLSKWTGGSAVGNSILYEQSSLIGIGTTSPNEKLTVSGAISLAHMDEPSETSSYGKLYVKSDGKLYYQDEGGTIYDLLATEEAGVGGEGSAGQVAFFTATSTLSGNSGFFWDNENSRLGIGTTTPSEKLEVSGSIKTTNFITSGFQLLTGAAEGRALISDASGIGTWQTLPAGTMPSGSDGQTMRYSNGASNWIASSFLYNNGAAIGIGTTTPSSILTVAGDMSLAGPMTITTTTLPQLVLKYDAENYLNISINSSQTEITASKALVINSITGEISFSANTIDASLASISGATFISTTTDSTVRKTGEKVFRGAIPIFRYTMPAQTNSTSSQRVSKYFETSLDAFPDPLAGGTRKYVFLINMADDIATSSHSEWRIYRPSVPVEYDSFTLTGQDLDSFEEGFSHISGYLDLPNDDWQLEVKVPSSAYTMRIFNIMLLAYDEIN
jgi:hypothetical protein